MDNIYIIINLVLFVWFQVEMWRFSTRYIRPLVYGRFLNKKNI